MSTRDEQAGPEPITLADVLDALNVFNKPRPGDGDEPWTEDHFISVKHLPDFLTVCYAAWYAAPPAAPQPQAAPLTAIIDAVRQYHADLDARKHGVAQGKAMHAIEEALGMPWVQGASLKGIGTQEGGAL